MDVLSTVASVATLADILHGASVTTYKRFTALREAPNSIKSLLEELQLFAETIGGLVVFVKEFERSPFALRDCQDLKTICSALDQCQIQITHLQDQAQAATSSPADGWFPKEKNRLHWAINAQKVEDARTQLHRHHSILQAALSNIARRSDIAMQKEISETRNEISNNQTKTASQLQTIKHDITSSTDSINQNVQQISTDVKLLQQKNEQTFAVVQQSSLRTNRDIDSFNQRIASYHHELRDLVTQINIFSLQEDPRSLSLLLPDMDAEDLSLCLGLLRPELAKVYQEFESKRGFNVSELAMDAVQTEVQALLALSYQQSAQSAARRSSSILGKEQQRKPSYATCRRFTQSTVEEWRAKERSMPKWSRSRFRSNPGTRTNYAFVSKKGTKGMFSIQWAQATEKDQERSRDIDTSSFHFMRIKFCPNRDICPVGVDIALTIREATLLLPRVSRYIRPFTVIPKSSDAIEYTATNNAAGLQRLLSSGEVSPFARAEAGCTLLWCAARSGSVDTYRVLLQEGADPLDCDVDIGLDSICATWMSLFHGGGSPDICNHEGDSKRRSTFCSTEENALDITKMTVAHQYNLSDFDIGAVILHCDNASCGKLLELICGLNQDTDAPYSTSKSSLFLSVVRSFALRLSLNFPQDTDWFRERIEVLKLQARILASRGVDINTRYDNGLSALSWLLAIVYLRSYAFLNGWDIESLDGLYDALMSLVEAIAFLIELGCDPNATFIYGEAGTISDFAAKSNAVWLVWRAAVAQAGFEDRSGDSECESMTVVKADDISTASERAAMTESLVRDAVEICREDMVTGCTAITVTADDGTEYKYRDIFQV